MGTHTIMKVCGTCNGTGKFLQVPFAWIDSSGNPVAVTEIDCPNCTGTGEVEWGDDRGIIKCPTSLILENVDAGEYTALTADQKEIFKIYISAGTLDMTEGTRAYGIFLGWFFPSGTASFTAITAALAAL